jgi:hypothetical protein
VLGYGQNDRGGGVSSPGKGWVSFLTTASRTALGPTQPLIQRARGTLSLGIKRPGREADHSPPSSAEVKNAWSYTSTPEYAVMAWCSVGKKAQGQLYLHVLQLFKSSQLHSPQNPVLFPYEKKKKFLSDGTHGVTSCFTI